MSSLSAVISRYTILVQHAESKVELVCINLIPKRYLEYLKLIYLVSAVGEQEKALVDPLTIPWKEDISPEVIS